MDAKVTPTISEGSTALRNPVRSSWNESYTKPVFGEEPGELMDMKAQPTEFQALRRAGRRGDRNMLCEVIMKTEVHCAAAHEPATHVARRMREWNIGFMPVCDNSGKILGTLTDRDIAIRLVAEELPYSTTVENIMSHNAVCCGAQDDIGKAQELMAQNHKSRIMCVDEVGRLEGIISLSDIAQLEGAEASRTLQQISERETRT